jgi:hypothetical protein
MTRTIKLGDVSIRLALKPVKNVHLSVHPPHGRITLVAPTGTRLEVARAYAISKLAWIRVQQEKMRGQSREPARRFVGRETHFLWDRRYLLAVRFEDAKPSVVFDHRRITLTVRPESDVEKRSEIMHDWHKSLLHAVVPAIIEKWEPRIGVRVKAYFLQRMKTKWGSANHRAGHIRLNTELVRKPRELLEYVVVHEMIHLIKPTHGPDFVELLDRHYPGWRDARAELNELPLRTERWPKSV